MTSEEAAELGATLRLISQAMMKALAPEPEKVYVCSFGSLVRHVHFYLIPKSAAMPMGSQLLDELAIGRWACTEEEAAAAASALRVELSKLMAEC